MSIRNFIPTPFRRLFLTCAACACLPVIATKAQTGTTPPAADTVRTVTDTARILNAADTVAVRPAKRHSARRATMLAAVLPGAGQIYNRRYLKAPLVYVGFGVIGYFIYTNNKNYQFYRQAFTSLLVADGTIPNSVVLARFFPDLTADRRNTITVDNLRRVKDGWRRYLEISVLSAAAFYALQIIDANVDAHLRGFDWNSDNLSLRLEPVLENQYAGLGLTLRW